MIKQKYTLGLQDKDIREVKQNPRYYALTNWVVHFMLKKVFMIACVKSCFVDLTLLDLAILNIVTNFRKKKVKSIDYNCKSINVTQNTEIT